jgi:hypothetical protein
MMVWLFAEKQTLIFIEFFNSIGTKPTLRIYSLTSASGTKLP